METNKFVMITVSLVVAVVLVTGVLIPSIGNVSSDGGEYTNENPAFKFIKTDNPSIDMDVGYVSNTHFLTLNSNDIQEMTLSGDSAIVYIDNNIIVYFVGDEAFVKVVSTNEIVPVGDSVMFSVYQDEDGVDVGEDYTSPIPEWAYIPDSTGDYGFYPTGADITKDSNSVTIQDVGTVTAISGTTEGSSQALVTVLSIIPVIIVVGLIVAAITLVIRKQ